MFKAYFHLSMELVRDVVKTMEEGMLLSFDDEGSKPVSAAFAAPIPAGNGPVGSDDENDGGSSNGGSPDRRARRAKRDPDMSNSVLLGSENRVHTMANSSLSPMISSSSSSSSSSPVLIGNGSRTFNKLPTLYNHHGNSSSTARNTTASANVSIGHANGAHPSTSLASTLSNHQATGNGYTQHHHQHQNHREFNRPVSSSSANSATSASPPSSTILNSSAIGANDLTLSPDQLGHLPLFSSSGPRSATSAGGGGGGGGLGGRPTSASSVTSNLPYFGALHTPRTERLGSIIHDPMSAEEHWPVMEAMSQDGKENERERGTDIGLLLIDLLNFASY